MVTVVIKEEERYVCSNGLIGNDNGLGLTKCSAGAKNLHRTGSLNDVSISRVTRASDNCEVVHTV
jgi:hypothetical protein